MLRNYLKIALRNIINEKGYTILNVIGLSIGLVLFILIIQFVYSELSTDRFHSDLEQIYRLEDDRWSSTPAPIGPVVQQQFPEIAAMVRFTPVYTPAVINYNNVRYKPESILNADTSFFSFFSFPLLQGNPHTVLQNPHSVVLSQTLAHKIFGDENPVGKTVKWHNQFDATVTGVMEDVPENSSIQFDGVASLEMLKTIENDSILQNTSDWKYLTFLKVNPQSNVQELEQKVSEHIGQYLASVDKEEFKEEEAGFFPLNPFDEIYFQSSKIGFLEHGNRQMVYIYLLIAVFILFIAVINFINLTTAKSAKRAKEVGVRKVVGSSKANLVIQFLTESVCISAIAIVLATGLVEIFQPVFNNLIQKELSLSIAERPIVLVVLLLFGVIVGIISGIYPAFFLTSHEPVRVLKGELTKGRKGVALRKALIVFQFAIAIFLMAATAIVYKQMQYARNNDFGFEKEKILYFKTHELTEENAETLRQKLLQHPEIKRVSRVSAPIGLSMMEWGRDVEGKRQVFSCILVDPDFVPMHKLEIVEGQNFSWDRMSEESEGLILNETAVKEFELQQPLGVEIRGFDRDGYVVGVVKDFNFHSIHQPIKPLALHFRTDWAKTYQVQITGKNLPATIEYIKKLHQEFEPEFLFEYHFFNASFEKLYQKEQRLVKAFGYFSVFALFIAVLGLIGLSTYAAQQRTKEIGVRRVLGASSGRIFFLLSRDFSQWVLLSAIIALPVIYWSALKWLQGFAFHFDFNILLFGLIAFVVTLIVMMVAFITITYQTLRLVRRNPVESLRYE